MSKWANHYQLPQTKITQEINVVEIQKYTVLAGSSQLLDAFNPESAYSTQREKCAFIVFTFSANIY